MNIEAFLLCDCATDSQGKLNVLGAFDTIGALEMPFVYPACAIAARIRFEKDEQGRHDVRITVIDEDGEKIIPPLDGKLQLQIPDGVYTAVSNLIVNIHGLKFTDFGQYSIDIAIDSKHIASLPLYVRDRKGPPA